MSNYEEQHDIKSNKSCGRYDEQKLGTILPVVSSIREEINIDQVIGLVRYVLKGTWYSYEEINAEYELVRSKIERRLLPILLLILYNF